MDMQHQDHKVSAEDMERMKKRNKFVGLSLAVFVVALGVISYFRIKGLTP